MVSVVGDPEITTMVRHHHERIDGGGYPDGLAGAAIPLGARIIAVADTFDAITSERPYRPASSQKKALDVLSAEAGAQLDANAVAAFRRATPRGAPSVGMRSARRPWSARRRRCSRPSRASGPVAHRSPRSARPARSRSLPACSTCPTRLRRRLARSRCCNRCRAHAKRREMQAIETRDGARRHAALHGLAPKARAYLGPPASRRRSPATAGSPFASFAQAQAPRVAALHRRQDPLHRLPPADSRPSMPRRPSVPSRSRASARRASALRRSQRRVSPRPPSACPAGPSRA